MKKYIIRILLFVFFLILLFGTLLGSFDFSCNKRIGKTDYYVGWAIGKQYTALYFGDEDGQEGIMGARIADVYWNETHILAKQCELYSDTLVGYYILKIVEFGKEKASKNMFGPLSEHEYRQKKQELHLNEKEMKHVNLFD